MKSYTRWMCLVAVALVSLAMPVSSAPTQTKLLRQIKVGSYGPKWSFDISYVDPTRGLYMLSDRDASSIDVIDLKTNEPAFEITGFTGNKGKSKNSGPQGIVAITGTDLVYAGDVNGVKVVDLSKRAIVKSIQTTDSGLRTDEGCYDPDDKIAMFNTPNDTIPTSAFIDAAKQTLIGKVSYKGADGVEACSYDTKTKSFYNSVPGTPANEGGEIDVIKASDVAAGHPSVSHVYPLTACTPTGNVLGPTIAGKPQLLISCDASDGKAGAEIFSLVMDVTDGSVTKFTQTGSADQVDYNPKTNKYYLAARNYYASGKNGVGPRTPVLGIIDAGSASSPPHFVENVPTCTPVGADGCANVAHSVAADPRTGNVYVPVATATDSFVNVYGE